MRPSTASLFALLSVGFGACASSSGATAPPLNRFHFPTGMAIDSTYSPDGGPRAHYLYLVANSNFDLNYNRGMLMAIDLDAYGPKATGLVPPSLAADAGWDGTPLQFPDIADAGSFDPANGFVYTDSEGGELQLVTTSDGGSRIILATRYDNRLAFVDVSGGALSCAGSPGNDCLNATSSPQLQVNGPTGANQILDVFSVSPPVRATLPDGGAGAPEVFVGHLRNETTGLASMFGGGMMGSYTTASPYNNYGAYGLPTGPISNGFVVRQSVDDPLCRIAVNVGIIPPSGVVGLPNPAGVFAIFNARFLQTMEYLPPSVRVLALAPLACPEPPPTPPNLEVDPSPATSTIDLSMIMKETDGRAVALSSNADRVFTLSRIPDSIVILRIDGIAPGALNLHPSSTVPLPPGPTELTVVPRTDPSGHRIGDLVAIVCADSALLTFYDDEIGAVTAAIPGVGDEPFAIAAAQRTLGTGPTAKTLPGVRFFVTAFGSGQVAVVDLPNLFDASTAQVVALLGTIEDTTANPINPNNQFLSLPYGYGGSPGAL